MKELRLLVGTIASGKSTLATELAQDGWVIINDDSIVSMLHGGDYTLYKKELKPLYKATETSIFTHAATMGLNICIDKGTLVRKEARKRWIGLAKSFGYNVTCTLFHFRENKDHAKARFNSDNRGLPLEHWLEVVNCHEREIDYPRYSEGFNEIKSKR